MNLTSLPQLARNANRLGEILTILSKYGLADWISRLDFDLAKRFFKGRDGAGLTELSRETRIRLVLHELGTTFIKLGQLLSTRPDLIGAALAKELSLLQDSVPADKPEMVRSTVEAELGQPIGELFAEFDYKAFASASIAQVHRARLKNGQAVVVKVQHPGIESRMRTDLDILVGLADFVERNSTEFKSYRPRATVAEIQRALLRELDFGREERNLQQFAANFAKDETVRFPSPISDLSTGRVLTMEFLDGVKIAEAASPMTSAVSPVASAAGGIPAGDREEIARRGASVFLEMIFRDGFYHADPHPGNILILPGGVIGLLDCGLVGHIDGRTREDFEEMLWAIVSGDAAELTSLLSRLGLVPTECDQGRLQNDLAEFLSYYSGQALDRLDLGGALTELIEIIRRHHIELPPAIGMLFKVLIMLEGTSRLLNPHFNLSELLQPYQHKLMWRRFSPIRHWHKFRRLLREWEYLGEVLPRGVANLLQQMQKGKVNVHLEHKRLQSSADRLTMGMLASALYLGSAWLWSNRVPPQVNGVSIFGVLGCSVSMVLGLRLLWLIWRSRGEDRE